MTVVLKMVVYTWLSSAEIRVVGCWLFFFFAFLMVQSSSNMLFWQLLVSVCQKNLICVNQTATA